MIGSVMLFAPRLSKVFTSSAVSTDKNTDALITWEPDLIQEMNNNDSYQWQESNWSNGDPFNCTWQTDNISFDNGLMILTLDNEGCPASCDNKPYASAEYRTMQEVYGFGYYEARFKAAAGDGLVTSFFTYTGTYGQKSHHEVDFEILGKDCNQLQTNYYTEGKGGNEQMIQLGFNACQEFHNYGLKLTKEELVFYVDGKAVRTVSAADRNKLPYKPAKIMVNLWAGIGVDSWLKSFTYPGKPIKAEYDWIKYASLDGEKTKDNVSTGKTDSTENIEKEEASKTGLSGKLVSVKKTGAKGDDGSPQVEITIHLENLPAKAVSLDGYIHTNQDWPAGSAYTEGKTSGDFIFTAYLYPGNKISPFFIKILDDNYNLLGRFPAGEEMIEIPFPKK